MRIGIRTLIRDIYRLQEELDARQPLDSDLTAIAALTTQPFGRGLLTLANVSALDDLIWGHREVSANVSLAATDVSVGITSACTVTLPAVADVVAGRPMYVETDVDSAVVACSGSDTISGDATLTMYADEAVTLVPNGVDKWRLA